MDGWLDCGLPAKMTTTHPTTGGASPVFKELQNRAARRPFVLGCQD